jgi:hypothetical protein
MVIVTDMADNTNVQASRLYASQSSATGGK